MQAKQRETLSVNSSNSRSTYYESLDPLSKERYDLKIQEISGLDPYNLPTKVWNKDYNALPEIAIPDLFNYLVLGRSFYTNDEFKAYKGLQAYNQFVSGWVQEVLSYQQQDGANILVKAKVLHSQRLSESPLEPWIILQKSGTVLSAHCTCMAGLGETCTHVAATLFFLEACVRLKENTTVTGKPSYWILPSKIKKAEYLPMSKISLTSVKAKKAKLDASISGQNLDTPNSKLLRKTVLPESSFKSFLNDVFEVGLSDCAIFSILPEFQHRHSNNPQHASSLVSLYSDMHNDKSLEELVNCDIDLTLSVDCISQTEALTKNQSKDSLWHSVREGRLTASKIFDICHTNLSIPSLSLLNSICYPVSIKSNAITWGCEKEEEARNAFSIVKKSCHLDFKLEKCGFFIHKTFTYFGASPDGLVTCSCCGKGCIEIKCPYVLKDEDMFSYISKNPNFYIRKDGDKYFLNPKHKYFYQVQWQMFVSNTKYCDFIVWSPKSLFLQRVYFEEKFIQENLPKIHNYFLQVVKPELLNKYFTKDSGTRKRMHPKPSKNGTPIVCLCEKEAKDPMIECDNQVCTIKWFHLACAGLVRMPKGKWFCVKCKPSNAKKGKNSLKRKQNNL